MRRRLLVLFAAAFVLMLGAVAFVSLRREREPEYQGRKLSEWIERYGSPHIVMFPKGSQPPDEDLAAIRHIGTNAIPLLIKWSLYREPGWQTWLEQKLPDAVVERLHLVDDTERRSRGQLGFSALGDAATPAIPSLSAIIDDPARGPEERQFAVAALCCIGREGVPALLQTMRNNGPTGFLTSCAIFHLCYVEDLGTNREEAGELLRAYVSGTNAGIACDAANLLGVHRLQPALSVPALATQLDKSPFVITAANALAQFGPDAKAALPKLAPWLTNSDVQVRHAATNAFARIAPEELGWKDEDGR